jgi:hypothetical protein
MIICDAGTWTKSEYHVAFPVDVVASHDAVMVETLSAYNVAP